MHLKVYQYRHVRAALVVLPMLMMSDIAVTTGDNEFVTEAKGIASIAERYLDQRMRSAEADKTFRDLIEKCDSLNRRYRNKIDIPYNKYLCFSLCKREVLQGVNDQSYRYNPDNVIGIILSNPEIYASNEDNHTSITGCCRKISFIGRHVLQNICSDKNFNTTRDDLVKLRKETVIAAAKVDANCEYATFSVDRLLTIIDNRDKYALAINSRVKQVKCEYLLLSDPLNPRVTMFCGDVISKSVAVLPSSRRIFRRNNTNSDISIDARLKILVPSDEEQDLVDIYDVFGGMYVKMKGTGDLECTLLTGKSPK